MRDKNGSGRAFSKHVMHRATRVHRAVSHSSSLELREQQSFATRCKSCAQSVVDVVEIQDGRVENIYDAG